MSVWHERDVRRLAGDLGGAARGAHPVEDAVTRLILCVNDITGGTHVEWLSILREPMEVLCAALAPSHDPGTIAVGVSHARVRLLTALGELDDAAALAQDRIDAMDPTVRSMPAASVSAERLQKLGTKRMPSRGVDGRSATLRRCWGRAASHRSILPS